MVNFIDIAAWVYLLKAVTVSLNFERADKEIWDTGTRTLGEYRL